MLPDIELITLVLITLCAAVVNGALGYGFSSITVPIALLFYTNRVLNPALVLVEVVLNGYILLISRKSVPVVWKRVLPIFAGLAPGIVAGSYVLSSINPTWLKLFVFAVLLPLILLQAAGVRKPIHSERIVGSKRFWIVSYEEFCRRPEELVKRVSEQILEQPIDIERLRATLKPFDISNKIRLDPELFEKIEQTLIRLNGGSSR